ncbi:hypothetical protein DH2020_044594 [Rehmannia glutinosa]|uniref:SIT4 phosphatase-associated family protein n=1 Tax=Rehmannia glutinosa TaxID=99300 RepID=A0ABR0UGQ9_REHGL
MFWKLTALSASSPVEAVLDKEDFTLEELLDEEEIIQECKALNSRLINLFPFIACEIFTCEIDVILKTVVEEEELMNLLFSFLEPNRHHSALLAGYFSKVVVCLMLRKTIPLMNYVKAHQDVFKQLVDLIGITSIMEVQSFIFIAIFGLSCVPLKLCISNWVALQLLMLLWVIVILSSHLVLYYQVLVRLVGADDHFYPNSLDVMQWLADSNLLEMIVDKLNTSNPPEVHANAAETLCAITRNVPSPLATKLSSPSFVVRIFGHALEDSHSKSALVHSLSVCISLLDPKRSFSSSVMHSFRSQHVYEPPAHVNPDTVGAMLPKLGELLVLLNVSSDEKVLPTTYGELRPPLGQHRLKIVEFLAVLLKSGNEVAEKELVGSGTIRRVLDLFFEYPYNNALHHHVESIIYSCLESKNSTIIDHLLVDCNLVGRILQSDKSPVLSGELNLPTIPASGKRAPRAGYFGHLTRISNKLIQLGNSDIQTHLQENSEWNEWRTTVLQERGIIENVYRWACGYVFSHSSTVACTQSEIVTDSYPFKAKNGLSGLYWIVLLKMIILTLFCSRPTALHDRNRDSDEEDVHDRDYDVAALANNLSQAFRYNIYDNDDAEGHGSLDRDDEDVYFDDESAEVVISSLRLGDDQGSTSDDDEVVVGEDMELAGSKTSTNGSSISDTNPFNGGVPIPQNDTTDASNDLGFFRFETPETDDPFGDRPIPEWVAWGEASDVQLGGSSVNPFEDQNNITENPVHSVEADDVTVANGVSSPTDSSDGSGKSDSSQKSVAVPSLFEEDVEFVGVELEGTEKAMEQALKEGIVGEAGPLKRNLVPKKPEKEDPNDGGAGMKEFNDANYWRVDQEVAVLE